MTTHHPIAIVGAGLGGLTAARVLQVNGISCTVFDLESDRHTRTQGGMLDIHDDSGQQAVRAAGLWDEFTAIIHPGGEAMRILDHKARVLREDSDDGGLSRPEVDRGHLRDMLLDSLAEGTVQWGHKMVDARPVTSVPGRHEVRFTNGLTITTDLLVGADGTWSKVRPLVSDAVPEYSGISFVEGDLADADARHPEQAAVMGSGMLFALRGFNGILGHREGDGSLHFYLGLRAAEGWVDTVDFSDVAASKAVVLHLLDGWADSLRGLVINADGALIPRRIHALPIGHSWKRVPGVTLLGDAAHVMSPFAGEGANLAMYDGAQLAQALAKHTDDVEAALSAYESELFPRSAEKAAESQQSLDTIFSAKSPKGLLDMFAAFDNAQEH